MKQFILEKALLCLNSEKNLGKKTLLCVFVGNIMNGKKNLYKKALLCLNSKKHSMIKGILPQF